MRQVIIITNNPKVIAKYEQHKMFVVENMREVFVKARDLIHLGHTLLSHPLAGSIKPNETPYRSLLVSTKAEKLDFDSLSHIEGAIRKYDQFQKDRPTPEYPESILEDFQVVDFTLFQSGYESIKE